MDKEKDQRPDFQNFFRRLGKNMKMAEIAKTDRYVIKLR